MPKTLQEYINLDKRYNGTQNDYNELITVKYYVDKYTSVKAILDVTNKRIHIGQVVIQFRH